MSTIKNLRDRLLLRLLSSTTKRDLAEVLSLDLELCCHRPDAYLPVAAATCRLADIWNGEANG